MTKKENRKRIYYDRMGRSIMRNREKKMKLFYGIMLMYCETTVDYLHFADYIRTVTPEQLYNDPYAHKHFERLWMEDGWLMVAEFISADPDIKNKEPIPVLYDQIVDMYNSLI